MGKNKWSVHLEGKPCVLSPDGIGYARDEDGDSGALQVRLNAMQAVVDAAVAMEKRYRQEVIVPRGYADLRQAINEMKGATCNG